MEVVMEAFGMTMGDFSLAAELKGSEMAQAICDGKIEAMIYTVGHPAAAVTEAATSCDVELVSVTGAPIDKLVADNSFYRVATVPGGMYAGSPNDTTTFGVGATVITSSDVPEKVITVVKAVFDNFADFKKLHPAFRNLKEEEMISDGLSAPLHRRDEILQGARLDVAPLSTRGRAGVKPWPRVPLSPESLWR